jgi:hypothetical protein
MPHLGHQHRSSALSPCPDFHARAPTYTPTHLLYRRVLARAGRAHGRNFQLRIQLHGRYNHHRFVLRVLVSSRLRRLERQHVPDLARRGRARPRGEAWWAGAARHFLSKRHVIFTRVCEQYPQIIVRPSKC